MATILDGRTITIIWKENKALERTFVPMGKRIYSSCHPTWLPCKTSIAKSKDWKHSSHMTASTHEEHEALGIINLDRGKSSM